MIRASHLSHAFLLSFLIGIFLLQWWQRAIYPPWLTWTLVFLMIQGVLCSSAATTRKAGALLLAISFGLTAALWTVARTTHVGSAQTIDFYATGDTVVLHGFIVDEPDRRPLSTKYTVEASHLQSDTQEELPVHGKVLVTDYNGWPEFHYGDEVLVLGTLERPEPFDTFSYDRYLNRYGIYSVMNRAEIEVISSGRHGNRLRALLYGIKSRFERQIGKLYPEPHASLMMGLLTGSRRGIPEHLLKDFNATGLTHLIAISGFNITIIISLLGGFLFFVPARFKIIPLSMGIVVFVLFVGAGAAVVRSAIMGTLGLLALSVGRIAQRRLIILWTLFFMLSVNPKYLWYDAGFQLSFLAVLGILELGPYLKRWLHILPTSFGIQDAIIATIAAQISAAPLIAMLFGSFSLVAPVANAFVAMLVPFAMLFGFLSTVVSFMAFPIGQLIAFLGFGCLEWIIHTAHLFATFPFASIQVSWFDERMMAALYGLVLLTLLGPLQAIGTRIRVGSFSPAGS